jgi:hypothetical protein
VWGGTLYDFALLSVRSLAWRGVVLWGKSYFHLGYMVECVRDWWDRERRVTISVFGYRVSRPLFVGACFSVAALIAVVVYALARRKPKKDEPEEEIIPQGGGFLFSDKRRALLNASLFITSLVSLGNLRLFREWSPYVSFAGWVAQLMPDDAKSGGCVLSPKCRLGKAKGEYMCGECATAHAVRTMDNPRFGGSAPFDPKQVLFAVCEDVYSKASLDWFWAFSPELQLAALGEKLLIDELKAGRVCVNVDLNGKVLLKSTREPVAWVNELHKSKMIRFVSGGILKQDLSAAECQSADVNSELGLGWLFESDSKVEEKSEDDFIPLSVDFDNPLGDNPPVIRRWFFLKNGVWTVWIECGVTFTGWVYDFKRWKNEHPNLSKVMDLALFLIAMSLVWIACAAAYGWVTDFVSSKFGYVWRKPEVVEHEAKGSLSRHREKAAGSKAARVKFEPDAQRSVNFDREFDARDRDFSSSLVPKMKNYVFYDITSLDKQMSTAKGLPMLHPDTRQTVFARNRESFDALVNDGFTPDTASIPSVPGIKISLEEWRANPKIQGAVKKVHWIWLNEGRSNMRLTDAEEKLLTQHQDSYEPYERTPWLALKLATSPAKDTVTPGELKRYREFLADGVINTESNVQTLVDKRCPHVLAGKKCGVGCIRCSRSLDLDKPTVSLEGVVGPVQRTPDLLGVYRVMMRDPVKGGWEKIGTCFGAPLGLMTARHVFYGDTSDLLMNVKDLRVECPDGRRFEIEPSSIITPSKEQLTSGHVGDFCRFQCLDKAFMMEVNSHRAAFRVLREDSDVRIMHFPPDSNLPILVSSRVFRKDLVTGRCLYKANTYPTDSGSPIFSDDGHVVGIHNGTLKDGSYNVFLLIYPDQLVTWFVQTQPLN